MTSPTDLPSSETIRVLHDRVSVRRFSEKDVSEDHVEAVLRAAFRAPTSSNIQSYSVIIVRDADTKAALATAAGNQGHVARTPVFLAFCADLTRIELASKRNGHELADNNLEVGLVSSIDASLVGMAAYMAADSLGLKGVMIGGVRNNPRDVARILGLPHRVYCVYGMCLGWPAETPAQKPRMDYQYVVHRERYDEAATAAAVDAYDPALAAHYRASGRQTTDDSWSHDMAAKFHPPLRDNLRADLKSLGFDFR